MKKWQLQSDLLVKDKKQLGEILLKNRNIDPNLADNFFNPPHPKKWQLSDLDFSCSDFNKIKKRLILAKKQKETVYIFGDYDSDGVCASAILWEGLKFLGISSLPFIPNRQEHGYGLSIKALKDLFKKQGKPELLITVDNGIVALPALKFLVKVGVEVIVTDHHQAGQKKLPVLAIFHSTKVCGAAVAWFLVKELFKTAKDQLEAEKKLNDFLSLAAIATVTDLMKLLGVNRSLVAHGLLALQKTQRPGLLALYQLSRLKKEDLNSYHLGYVLGPRINAMGRLADSMDALRLVCTKNKLQAKKLAALLQETNIERQDLTEDLIDQAESSLTAKDKKEAIIIIDGDYHEGVVGLLAGKLAEKYLKPSIVLSVPKDTKDSKAVIKASARSLAGFNITEFLRQVEDELLSVGGHPLAAGFSLTLEKLDSVKKRLLSLAKKQIAKASLKQQINVDCELATSLINLEIAGFLESFEPYGNANPRPIFLLENLLLQNIQYLGSDGQHAKLFFRTPDSKQEIIVLSWRALEKHGQLDLGQSFDLLLTMAVNRWRGHSKLQTTLTAIKKSTL
jgi:single-stranded-DNA-specific exonuclease